MLDQINISDFLQMNLPEEQTRELLLSLTPDNVDFATFQQFVNAMRQTGVALPELVFPVTDCCGTGGSGLSHYNTSTTVAFVLAAAGVPVVKFGNRAVTSKSGSFDFLETLGIPLETPLEHINELLEKAGVVFLFAPQVYPMLGKFNTLRRSLGVRTIFNFMGPLLNPTMPAYRLLGVSHEGMQSIMAKSVLEQGGTQRALVVRAANGLDEIDCNGSTHLFEINGNHCTERDYNTNLPKNAYVSNQPLSVYDNVAIFRRLIQQEDTCSYYYHLVCENAGAGLYVGGKADSIEDGKQMAKQMFSDGKVAETVEQCRRCYVR